MPGSVRTLRAVLALLLLGLASPRLHTQPVPPVFDQGGVALGLELRRLNTTARVLYVTAHPDDEHNGVLVMLSRGRGVRTALLTLSRGEGGQNEIGPELGDALGVLRTEELMSAHRFDGAEQYFGRERDFGFSFSVDENLEKWGRDEALRDVVRALRTFRPDVVLTLPFEAPGGGMAHQAVAQLVREAFRAAADPARFPEQVKEGLLPWQARKLYQGGVGGSREKLPGNPVVLRTSAFDPLLGASWQELGSLARSMHRCQGTSQVLASPGEGEAAYWLADSEPPVPGVEQDLLEGIDTSLPGLVRFAHDQEARAPFLAKDLEELGSQVASADAGYDPRSPEKVLPWLVSALDRLRALTGRLRTSTLPVEARYELLNRLEQEERELVAALGLAHGLTLEVVPDDDAVVPGQTLGVKATLWNRGTTPVRLDEIVLSVPDGWSVKRTAGPAGTVPALGSAGATFQVRVADRPRFSQPHYRRNPQAERNDADSPALALLPWLPPPVVATARYASSGVAAQLQQPALWRYEGQAGGQKEKPVSVVPAFSVSIAPELAVVRLPATRARTEFRVAVANQNKGPASATLHLELPAGWSADPPEAPLGFRYEGEETAVRFALTPPEAGAKEGDFPVRAVVVRDRQEYRDGVQVIAYDHVQERTLVRPAVARLEVMELRAGPANVGYVMGTGDDLTSAIKQMGVPLTLLAETQLQGDLSKFTTIVVGVRAYEVRSDLRAQNLRLIQYAEDGGNLVLMHQRAAFNYLVDPRRVPGMALPAREAVPSSPFVPFPAAVSSRRVSDERAPVLFLVADHPLLRRPNTLTMGDWEGWVAERGAYLLDTRDSRYTDLLTSADSFPSNPGDQKGLLVEAKLGKGTWTYVGLSLFRQVPAGVPGAWRLLANLVSRPKGR